MGGGFVGADDYGGLLLLCKELAQYVERSVGWGMARCPAGEIKKFVRRVYCRVALDIELLSALRPWIGDCVLITVTDRPSK